MPRGCPNGLGARPLGVLALCGVMALAAPAISSAGHDERAPGPAPRAAAPAGGHTPGTVSGPGDTREPGRDRSPSERWFSIGLLAGTTQFDAGLADYQWDTTPRRGWGARGLIGRGRLATGLRVWRASTTQSIGDLGPAPAVRATSWELVGEGRIGGWRGTELLMTAGAGRLHLGYHPDRITIQPPGGVGAIVVDLTPVGTWIGGGGLALRRAVARGWTMDLGVDARVFAIDTAHRAGSAITVARETFGDWNARLEFAWTHGRR